MIPRRVSGENDSLANAEPLRVFLKAARRFIPLPKEPTLFSLAGRGHYENAASDLLAFFFNPVGPHGLGALFLRAFFECIGEQPDALVFDGVSVKRENSTPEGKFIDLLIQGNGWVLVIENKIHHLQNNPFSLYETHVRETYSGTPYFAILSPGGTSILPGTWKPVSYKNYCLALRKSFASAVFDRPYSKWLIFAREFVLHFENELYSPTMTPAQLKFIEQNLHVIEQVKVMSQEYADWILREFQAAMKDALSPRPITVKNEGWALRCYVDPSRWSLALQTPANTQGNPDRKFRLIVYLRGMTAEQYQAADKILAPATRRPEGQWNFWVNIGPDDGAQAIEQLARLASQLANVLQTPDALTPSDGNGPRFPASAS